MSGAIKHGNEVIRHGLDHLAERASELKAEVKPKLRGWLHLGTAPLTLAAGIVLIVLSPTADHPGRLGGLHRRRALILFTVSAIYHRGTWSPRAWAFLRRFDHSNIFLLIAGSYTPFTLLLLEGAEQVVLLSVVWSGAVLGVLFRVFWTGRPALALRPDLHRARLGGGLLHPELRRGRGRLGVGIGTAVLVLVIVGGGLYTLGGVVYGFKRPDPFPRWFGFHEVFHTLHDPGLRQRTTSASRWRRTPCAEPLSSISARVGDRALADQVAADVRRRAAVDRRTRPPAAGRRRGRRRRPRPPRPGGARGPAAEGVAVRARRPDHGDLDRAVEHRLGGGQRPAGEPRRLLGERPARCRAPPRRPAGAGRSR